MMRKVNDLFILACVLLSSCERVQHKWQFEIKNECRFPDAYHIKTTFTPVRYHISIKGSISDNSMLYKNIHSTGSRTTSTSFIKLASGKIDYSENGEIYEENFNLIYVPGREVQTNGWLVVTVEVY